MTRITALPHPDALSGVVPGPWLTEMHGKTETAGSLLPGWDYSVPVSFECAVEVDIDAIWSQCKLGPDDEIGLTATLECQATFLRQVCDPVRMPTSGRYDLVLAPSPQDVGSTIRLDRMIILLRGGSSASPLAAIAQGSVLWRESPDERLRVVLEGDATRFPTETRDFAASGQLDPDAPWHLELDLSQVDASPMHSVRLFLNETHPAMAAVIGGDEDSGPQAVASAMQWDVARRMIHAALNEPEFVGRWGCFPDDSIGLVVESLIRRISPGEDATSLRQERKHHPDRFETRLQGRLSLFGEST